ncbi:response regulator transcription factor [Streptomyces antimicrobicus]|uniref:Response regulator transcription factor n=1 Tax=Streptomyces antimicrobicus TaxID=2883108 RepID=A0ABS8BEX7_9ACTN|nr:response regulator transcription factor [Streptomyces antimicrobicus]MCB5183061.1 response regulator transcription factor [Streptomyces antimicrobicus]
MTRILVLHSVNLLGSALTALLRAEGAFEVAHAAWPGAEQEAESLRPDVCVVDADCPGASAVLDRDRPARTGVLGRGAALLVLATPDRPGSLRRAFQAQAHGYVDKDGPAGRLVQAVHKVAGGERSVDASLASALLEHHAEPLSRRERSVLARAADGDSVAEIAHALHLARGTVRNYIASASRKVGARNRVDAIRICRQAGWV